MAHKQPWVETYRRFLEHEDLPEEEVEEQVQNAVKTVDEVCPRLKPKIVTYLNGQSRDDFVQVDWGMIEILKSED